MTGEKLNVRDMEGRNRGKFSDEITTRRMGWAGLGWGEN
jgi:hypothetical protein